MSVQITFSSQSKQQLKKGVKAYMKRFHFTEQQALDAIALDIRSSAMQNLDNNGTTDRGRLKNSITVTKTLGNGRRISTTTGYGLYVEFGRAPGERPNTRHLTGWVRRKLGLSGKEAKSAAFLIARKISKQGTKAQPFLRPAFEKEKKKLILELRKSYKRNAQSKK